MKNAFQITHIIGAMQGLFLFLVLVMRKENKLPNKILGVLMLLISLNLGAAFIHTNNNEIIDLMAIGRSDMFILSYGPLLMLYALYLTGFKKKFKPKQLLHLLPAIIMLVVLILGSREIEIFPLINIGDVGDSITLKIWYIIHPSVLIHMLLYLLYGLKTVNQYKKQLSSYFSQSGKIYLLWLRILMISITCACVLAIIHFLIYSFGDAEGVLQWIISGSIVTLIFVMGYFTNTQPDILKDLNEMDKVLSHKNINKERTYEGNIQVESDESSGRKDNLAKYEKNRLSEAEEKENLKKLLCYIEENKPYLNPELNLAKLSKEAGIPAHQISMLLSIYLNQNFYTFVNSYRIKEAKMRLTSKDSKQYTILSIAFDSGFNSKSTFNTVFKKFEKITPSEYRLIRQDEKSTKS